MSPEDPKATKHLEGPRRRALRVFISSTSEDLADHRKAVLRSLGSCEWCEPVCMEVFVAEDAAGLEVSLNELRRCDIYVGIFAKRYGFVPKGQDYSITEAEYREAVAQGIPVLAFLLRDNAEWSGELTEKGKGASKVAELRRHLLEKHHPRFFGTRDELVTEVAAAVSGHVVERARRRPAATTCSVAPERRQGTPVVDVADTFRGREAEIGRLAAFLADEATKLVWIAGRPGMGKTALAAKLGCEIEENDWRLPAPHEKLAVDGVFYAARRSEGTRLIEDIFQAAMGWLGDPLASQIAEYCSDGQRTAGENARFLLKCLQQGRYLIVLDNCEDIQSNDGTVADEPLRAFLETFLETKHGVTILATSRFPLSVAPHLVRRMRLFDLDKGLPVDEAVALLVDFEGDRALGLRTASPDVLRQAATILEGIPRALSIMTSLMDMSPTLSVGQLVAAPERLRACIDTLYADLYRQLDSGQRMTLEVLAVLQEVLERPVPEDAIRVLLQRLSPDVDIPPLLAGLVRLRIVNCSREAGLYVLHPQDQEYVYSQLPDAERIVARHGCHVAAAGYHRDQMRPSEDLRCLRDVDHHLAAFEHCVRAGLHDGACGVLNMIDREHLGVWGRSDLVIDRRLRLEGNLKDPAMMELNKGNLGATYLDAGDHESSIPWLLGALELSRRNGARRREGRWLGNLSIAYSAQGDALQAAANLRKAQEIAEETGDLRHQGRWGYTDGLRLWKAGQAKEAIVAMRRAHEFLVKAKDRRFLMFCLKALGGMLATANEAVESARCFDAAGEVAISLGAYGRAVRILDDAARGWDRLGEEYRLVECLERKLLAAENLGDRGLQLDCAYTLATRYMDLWHARKAIEHYDRAMRAIPKEAPREVAFTFWNGKGVAYSSLKDAERAIECYERALAVARECHLAALQAISLYNIGDTYFCIKGDMTAAEEYLLQALAFDEPACNFKALSELGMVALRAGRNADAGRYFARTLDAIVRGLKKGYSPSFQRSATGALALLGMGMPEAAREALRKGMNLNPSRKDLQYAIADTGELKNVPGRVEGLDETLAFLDKALAEMSSQAP